MNNKKILIVGLGLIGGSYAEGLTSKGYFVGALSDKKEDIDYALAKGIIKVGENEVKEEFIKEFDVLIFALYPYTFINWIKENQKYIKSGALISDVTGIKKVVVNEIESILRKDLDYVPTHPMAGREVPGVKNASKDIFKGANFIIIPRANNKKENIDFINEIANALEFKRISKLNIDEHDEMIGYLSQLTHCIAISLMNAKESEDLALYTGDSFKDLTRIAKINENMWCELFLLNKEKLIIELDNFINEITKLRNAISNDDEDAIKMMMKESTKRREYFDKK